MYQVCSMHEYIGVALFVLIYVPTSAASLVRARSRGYVQVRAPAPAKPPASKLPPINFM